MTGWGQDGPMAKAAGHDLNFIGLTGMLDMLAHDGEPPRAPQNLLGDYGSGGLYLALGTVAALVERGRSGRGQVVDAAIVDGAASMLAPIIGMVSAGLLPSRPAEGMLGGDALFYRSYRCADGRFIAVGALEAGFRRALTDRLGLAPDALDDAGNVAAIEALFATRGRDEWMRMFEGSDCCLSPVLALDEAPLHPHLAGRGAFVSRDGRLHPAPAPRFSRTPSRLPDEVPVQARLHDWGVALMETAQ
jgi:alpha-methylacyl-CoA racemase